MKKIFTFLMGLMLVLGVNSCKCTSDVPVEDDKLVVETLVEADRQDVVDNYVNENASYLWFETCVSLTDFLDEDGDHAIESVSNIFQVVEENEEGADTQVILYSHTADTSAVDVRHTFWVEDKPLNDVEMTLTFEEALERVFEVNLPKPHSKQAVLRKELGPNDANPQWIFGNKEAQIYVDAVTGDASDVNPVFPEGKAE